MTEKHSEAGDRLSNTSGTRKNSQNDNIVKDVIKEYCSNTGIHGIAYLGAKDKSLAEKVWWTCVIVLSIICCGFYITKLWTKWKTNPVIISFEHEQTAVWEIPFPAVTLCPLNKIPQFKYNFTEIYQQRDNLLTWEYKQFWDTALMCNLEQYDFDFNCTLNTTDKEAIENMRQAAWNLSELFFTVNWKGTEYDPEKLFSEQLTEEGICFTFNSFSQDHMFTKAIDEDITYISQARKNVDWTLEDGYPDDSDLSGSYPRRTAREGSDSGLHIFVMDLPEYRDYVCGSMLSGFKLILHNPAETPRPNDQYYLFPIDKAVTFRVVPQLTTTSENLQLLSPSERKCYFSNEKTLKFYKVYTQSNCHMECKANVTKHLCDCVPFYMPRDKDTPICAFGKTSCINDAIGWMLKFAFYRSDMNVFRNMKQYEAYTEYNKCNCLPSCSDIQYTAELSQTNLHFLKSLVASGLYDQAYNESENAMELIGQEKMKILQIDIFFKDMQFMALHRSELYGKIDFLANCGGFLGLFLGFSMLSLLEIFYYLTIRLYIKFINRRKTNCR